MEGSRADAGQPRPRKSDYCVEFFLEGLTPALYDTGAYDPRSVLEGFVPKVVYRSLNTGRLVKSASRAVDTKRVAGRNGRKTVRTLDANDDHFDDGLRYVFTQNVAKARRENRRLTGTSDVAPRKR